ncbi:MAG: Arc family DNA-binding protein [Pirellula staleyi]
MAKRDSFLLRLSPAMLEAVRRWADDEFRSMNSQIEMVLQRALKEAGRMPSQNEPQPAEKNAKDLPDENG